MIADLDIDRSAWLMIKLYGADAVLQAALRVNDLLDEGDTDGAKAWQRIISAIQRLQMVMPAAVHFVETI